MTAKKKIVPKVMDITHPSMVKPSLTSKPVIITNRPMIAADPMISKAAEAAVSSATKRIEVSEQQQSTQQQSEPVATPELPSSAPVVSHREKIILPLSEQTEQPETNDSETTFESKAENEMQAPDIPLTTPELPDAVNAVKPATEKTVATPIHITEAENTEEKIETVASVQSERLQPKKAHESTIEIFTKEDLQKASGIFKQPTPDVPSNDTDEDGTLPDSEDITKVMIDRDSSKTDTIFQKVDPPKTASTKFSPRKTSFEATDNQLDISALDEKEKTTEEKQLDEIETLIAKGTYALPINQTGKRRERIVLGILVIVLLLMAMLDVLLDLGVISLPWIPHTTFFSLK